MRMILPQLRDRRTVDRLLTAFFSDYREFAFRRAISLISRFYNLRAPRVDWYEYLDWGKSGGRTYENGKIHLVHPENWKRGRKYNSQRQWIATIYHEMAHYVFWSDAERKADTFAWRFIRGIAQSTPTRGSVPRTVSRARPKAGVRRSRSRRRPRRSRFR